MPVVMQEQCEANDGLVTIRHAPKAGEWIRRTGEDISVGSVILAAGTRLRSQELGLAASIGMAELNVRRKLRVAVFFTGDELAMPGEPLAPGAIYNSNRFTLRALLENLGCEVRDFGIVPDSLEATRNVLRQAADGNDLIITSGGVSVGEEDHIKPAVEAEGKLNMWQIAVKPGKPLAFGEVGQAFFPRPARESGVELRHLPVVRAPIPAAPAGRRRAGASARHLVCAPISTGQKLTAATNSCALN